MSVTAIQTSTSVQSELDKSFTTLKAMARALPDSNFMLMALMFMNEGETKVTANQFKYFTGPVIFGRADSVGAWGLPQESVEKLTKAARLDRFCLILDEISGKLKPEQTCTSPELVCAIQPYTLVAPLTHNLAAICTNAFGDTLANHPKLFPGAGDILDGFKTPITDKYELRDLQLTIRRKVVARGYNPLVKHTEPSQSQTKAEDQPNPGAIQMKLF